MFNRALFKQSCKANFSRWLSITAATSLILMMLIIVIGNMGGIGGIKESLTAVFTTANEESSIKENAVDSYDLYLSSIDIEHSLVGLANGNQTLGESEDDFKTIWNTVTGQYEMALENFEEDNGTAPTEQDKEDIRDTLAPALIEYFQGLGIDTSSLGYSDSSIENMLVCLMKAYDGNDVQFGDDSQVFFTQAKPILTKAYEYRIYQTAYDKALEKEGATEEFAALTGQTMTEMAKEAMQSYSGNGINADYNPSIYEEPANEYVIDMLYAMAEYIAPENYTEQEVEMFKVSVKVLSNSAINTYQLWLDEGLEKADAKTEATKSITDQIPEEVGKALKELGAINLTDLIVGGMFYQIAGILLPLVFVMTTANGLLAGQVDSGSMAYVLSTPTKRRTVTVTQMSFLILSLVAMFGLLILSSVITLAIVGDIGISYFELVMLSLGGFVTAFAFAGVCFMCSAFFNRSKHSLGFGGGFTIFSIVCTILGIFGSNLMPSILRISAMNKFNYLSIISLFDVTSILSGGTDFIWKLCILAVIGIGCFIAGIIRFDKKDLPL